MTPRPLKRVIEFGRVGAEKESYVCPVCLGPVNPGYIRCFACDVLFNNIAESCQPTVVPISAALNPSPWYTSLVTYKSGNPERARVLARLLTEFWEHHAGRLVSLLGGTADLVSVVPSKRGISFSRQPLRAVVEQVVDLRPWLTETATFTVGEKLGRRQYRPSVFDTVTGLKDKGIVLVEDLWVTGATALSASGALYRAGARKVLIVPIARCVDKGFWPDDHPYRVNMNLSFDPAFWPR